MWNDVTVLSMVAHDLTAPLQCIQHYSDALIKDGLPRESRDRMLRAIHSCTQQAFFLVQDLRTAVCLEQGGLTLSREETDLSVLAHEAAQAMEGLALHRGVSVEVSSGARIRTIAADPRRLRQVLDNLLSNALKHIGPGGRVEVGIADSSEQAVLWVWDDGEGIAPEDLVNLFQKFYQAPRDRGRGLGLGLYLCRSIVEAHGGSLWASSPGLGQGACFAFNLPRRLAAEPRGGLPRAERAPVSTLVS